MQDFAATAERAERAPQLDCRKLRPGESGLYRALRLESLQRFSNCFGVTFEEEARLTTLAFEAAIEARAADRFVVGAFCGERLIGLAAFTRRERRKTMHRGDISQVYVDPVQRGRSIGQRLMLATLASAFELSGLEQVELSVVSTNTAALRLYATLGFETYGVQQNYFKVGANCWDMCLMQLTRERHFARN